MINDAAEFAPWLSPHVLVNTGRVLATVLKTPDEEVDEYLQVLAEMAEPEKSSTLCGLGVFVKEPAEPVMPDDFGIGVGGLGQRSQRAGLFQGPVWPVSIEMGLVFGKNHP